MLEKDCELIKGNKWSGLDKKKEIPHWGQVLRTGLSDTGSWGEEASSLYDVDEEIVLELEGKGFSQPIFLKEGEKS